MISDAQLRWQSRRGMLELDLMLSRFNESALASLHETQRDVYQTLLNYSDPYLYALLMGEIKSDNDEINQLIHEIRAVY